MRNKIIEVIENAARTRGDIPVPRVYISMALQRVTTGVEHVRTYPGGALSLKGIYEIADRLCTDRMTVH